MQAVTGARVFGALALALGAGLMAFGEWGPGLGVATAGAAAALLVTERAAPPALPDRSAAGPLAALGALARDLKLEGRGVVIPGRSPEEPSRLFVPARDGALDALPPVDAPDVVQRAHAGAVGALFAPPGAGLEAEWRATSGLPEGAGAEEATAHLRRALPALGLGASVVVARGKSAIRVAYTPLAFAGTCRETREAGAPWHVQGGCPACSFAAILVARALKSPVRLAAAGVDGERVYLDLEVAARSPA